MTYTIPRLLTHTTLHTLTHTYTRTHTLTHIHLHKWPHLLRLSLCTTTSWSGCAISDSSSVLQCVAVCCSVLQCVAACCSVLQRVSVCCSVLQCVAVCCSVLQWDAWCYDVLTSCDHVLKSVVMMSWKLLLLMQRCHERVSPHQTSDIRDVMWHQRCEERFTRHDDIFPEVLKRVMMSWNASWSLETLYDILKRVVIMSWKMLWCLEKRFWRVDRGNSVIVKHSFVRKLSNI